MTALLLSSFLPNTPRNRDGLAAVSKRITELGYRPRTTPVDEPDGCTRTRCAGVHQGYPGSEHRMALHCLLCNKDIEVFPSHMRERNGANPKPPSRHKSCPYAGPSHAAKRAARYAALGLALPAWDADAHATLTA
ncbi:hypothetical protein [Streptomyces sp. bgisy060]|uniref:hypothetical protein n=1 Tax=Streptomyces sp. bgisy060 TaxID=3413775 RepID=UPI003EB6FBC4